MRTVLLFLGALVCAACAVDDDDAETTMQSESELSVPDFFGNRIAMARFYQHSRSAVPKSEIPRKVDELAQVNPTYVSGLVRLDPTDNLTDDHLAAYRTLHEKMPKVKYDIVLNAEQYKGQNGWERLRGRMQDINGGFEKAGLPIPDAIFFDFYSQGDVDVMEKAAKWAQGQKPSQKIGGTFWAVNGVPAGTDFLVLDDHDGLDRMVNQSKQIRKQYGNRFAVLAHVENNPGKPKGTGDDGKNLGLDWVQGKLDPNQYIKKQKSKQNEGGFRVMYPVHFPLKQSLDAWDPDSAPGYLSLVAKLM
jgi:hypothetical protein